MDRKLIAQALAKALAYKQCSKQAEAETWARTLVELLECADILKKDEQIAASNKVQDEFNRKIARGRLSDIT